MLAAAVRWQSLGCQVLPCQPDGKMLVKGYGPSEGKNKVQPGEETETWFSDRSVNLCVVVPNGWVVLDFDDLQLFFEWCKNARDLARSYCESTPGTGRHIWLRSSVPLPPGLRLISGVEIKTSCLVAPSCVTGKPYQVLNHGPVLLGDVLKSLEAFILPCGDRLPPLPKITIVGAPDRKFRYQNAGPHYISDLKLKWPIVNYLRYFEPDLVLLGRGRFLAGLCRWHHDTRPSLWVDTLENRWGCHSCKLAGDILTWHMLRLMTDSYSAAIRDLARYRVEATGSHA
jgi:hypothetical protein